WHDILYKQEEIDHLKIYFMSKILWGFTLGLVTGLLLAPEKGSETRQRISRKANDLKEKFDDFIDSVTEKFDSFRDDAENMANNARREARSFADEARNTM